MNITVKKGVTFTVDIDWVDCTTSSKKETISKEAKEHGKYGVVISNAVGQLAVGATANKTGYSPAAMLALIYHNCLCVIETEGKWWIASTNDSLPVTDMVVSSLDEAVLNAQALMGVMNDAVILGDIRFFTEAFPETTIQSLTFEELYQSIGKTLLKQVSIKKLESLVNLSQLVLIGLMAPAIYWLYFYDATPDAPPELTWEEIHNNEVVALDALYKSTIKNNPKTKINSIMDTVNTYPATFAGWRIGEISCIELSCNMKWEPNEISGSFSDFNQRISEFEKARNIVANSHFSNDGLRIDHTFSISYPQFVPSLDQTLTQEDFYIRTLSQIQDATHSKVFGWSLGSANMSSRLTPSPTGQPLEPVEFNYGVITLNGSGLSTISEIAERLTAHQISVNELVLSMSKSTNPTWSIKGNYVYR